jgi:hypothetical protein
MYFPADPKKNPVLWSTLRDGLISSYVSIILEGGKAPFAEKPRKVTSEQAAELMLRLQKLEYVRVGTSRLLAVPPHFGVAISGEGKFATLTEYVALDNEPERRNRDITLLVDLIYYEMPDLWKLHVPLNVSQINSLGIEMVIDEKNDFSNFFRISAD